MSTKKQEKKSFILELRKEGRVNEDFLNTVSCLKLEELIAIKLEMSSRMLSGKLYNFPIWYSLPEICKDAMVMFAKSCCKTKADMASLLGVSYTAFLEIYKKYNKDKE